MSLDQLLTKGPPHGNIESGLDQLRFHILTQGIPAKSDGMVRSESIYPFQLAPS
jgi:cell cycle arrest protein BUB2